MLMPLVFAPFDGYLVIAVVGLAWLVRHRRWHRNATVRRLDRLVKRGM
jgi:hypothetical protein